MEQEQTLYKIKDVSKLTGELFLKILFYMTETIQDRIQTYQANKTFVGETNWNKFMATDAPKEIKQFRSEEMKLLVSHLMKRWSLLIPLMFTEIRNLFWSLIRFMMNYQNIQMMGNGINTNVTCLILTNGKKMLLKSTKLRKHLLVLMNLSHNTLLLKECK